MPPKKGKKKGKKKSAKPKTPTVIDGMSTEEMSKEQLEEHIGRLREELDREREERNYFQLERDKVNTFWEITKRQLDETRAELRNKDREMEDAEERHQIEIKVYKQKVKHLLYEHQNNITELKTESSIALKRAQEEHRLQESELRKDKRSLKVANKEQELAHEDADKDLRMKNDEYVTRLREDFEREAREIEAKYEKKMKVLRDELELRRKTEIHEIEERKNGQINALMRNHEKVSDVQYLQARSPVDLSIFVCCLSRADFDSGGNFDQKCFLQWGNKQARNVVLPRMVAWITSNRYFYLRSLD